MIDAVEPLSCVLWAVALFAAGMYPLGFMLGAPCSPCCKSQCDDVVEFNRCIRFVNTDTSSPPTNVITEPLHGYSRAVTEPEQVGAVRVATKLKVSCSTQLSNYAAEMSDGETRSSTYRIYYISADYNYTDLGSDIGTALQWNVTLQGVTRPPEIPDAIQSLRCEIDRFGSRNSHSVIDYPIGDSRLSIASAVSVSVHSASIASGGEWVDGSAVTEQSLKAMVATSVVKRNSTWVSQLVFSPGTAFQYLPAWSEVALSYVIKHSRGSKHRFKTFNVTVVKTDASAVTAIPSGGLQPVTTSQPPYADTPYNVTPPVFSGNNATIYSDNAVWNGPYTSVTIAFPDVEISPTGPQLRSTRLALDATEGQHLQQSFANSIGRLVGTPTAFGWIMRPFDPGVEAIFNGTGHPVQNQWNYDTEAVLSFLSGESTMPYNSGNQRDPTRALRGPPPSTSWTMQVSDPTKFCGYSLCGTGANGLAFMHSDAIAKSVRVNAPPYPSEYQTSDEKGTRLIQVPCQHPPVTMTLRLSGNCTYDGQFFTCQNPSSNNAFWTRMKSMSVRAFYCGDLLWAIENGPCRNSLSFPYLNWGNETYTLDGDASAEWINHAKCHVFRDQNEGACIPLEATANLDDIRVIALTYDAIDEPPSVQTVGTLSGDCVFSATSARYTAFLCGPIDYVVPLLPTNCVRQVFGGQVQVPQYGPLELTLFRSRTHWCSEWGSGDVRPTHCGAFLVATKPNQPPPECTFGESQPLLPKNTATAPTSIVPSGGGTVNVAYCCPDRTEQVTIPPNTQAFSRQWLIETRNAVGMGKTAYVTQYGYRDGDGQCPFSVMWFPSSTGISSYAGHPGRLFAPNLCPIVGQVNHAEQPSCEWYVESGTDWLSVEKTPEGLLSVSINASITPSFSGSFLGYSKPFRAGTITITSGGTTAVWSIIQLQP